MRHQQFLTSFASFLRLPRSRAFFAKTLTVTAASLLILLGVTGCVVSKANSNTAPLAIVSFAAAPATLTTGQTTLLSWSVTGVKTLTLSDGSSNLSIPAITPVSANSVSITPTTTTTYTLTAVDNHGASVTATVLVTVVPLPVITSFTATPPLISDGQSSTLAWTVTGAATLSLDNGIGAVTANSQVVQPGGTTTYTLTATNAAGASTTATATVTVVLAPVIVSFAANPAEIGPGQSSTLSWYVVGATSISIDNGIGVVTGTSITVSPTATTTYTLTATNAVNGFSVSSAASTTVKYSNVPAPVIAAFNASVPSIGPGGVVTLTPVFTPADGSATATIDQGVGPVTSGVPVNSNPLNDSTTFTLTVTNSTGSTTAQTRVLAGNVAVFAGLPTSAGYQDGQGTDARFFQPAGIVPDKIGNIYLVDQGNQVIRSITPGGLTSTLAGTADTSGSLDGVGLSAEFNNPYGITIDSAGNLYITDAGNATIREILANTGGQVITLAGTPLVQGFQDGPAATATFGTPQGIAVDKKGNLYIADSLNCNIRKLDTLGNVSTLAGPTAPGLCGSQDGTGSAARFRNPVGLAIDSVGNLYVADQGNSTIRIISPQGLVTTLAGTAGVRGSQDGSPATFHNPLGIAIDSVGNLYVTDSLNYTLRKVTPQGIVSTIVGKSGNPDPTVTGGPLPSRIGTPTQIAVDPTSGNLFFTMAIQAVATAPY